MRAMRSFLLVILILPNLSFGKKDVEAIDTFLLRKEIEVEEILMQLRNEESDSVKNRINSQLIATLEEVLPHQGVMDYPFETWTTMSTIASPDGKFRIFNWNVEDEAMNHHHYCYMVIPAKGNKPNRVIEFHEDRVTLPPRPQHVLRPENWYGALYYKIVPVQKGRTTLYTIIGYSGANRNTNKKILDVFYFKGRNVRMGFPIFQEKKGSSNLMRRVFIEYSEKAVVTVNFNPYMDAIVFDHLIPETPNLEGMYDFYIPDMTYDAYYWENGIWRFEEDVVAFNNSSRKYRTWYPTDSGDSSDYDLAKNNWINPVDPNAVGSGSNPVAPVEIVKKDKDGKAKKKKTGRRKFKLFQRKNRKKPRSAIGAD